MALSVLYITHYTSLYGANRSLLQLILELREKDLIPTVLLPPAVNNKSELKAELQKNGIDYIETPVRSVKHPVWWKTIPNYLLALWYYPTILKALRGRKFDIIHTNCSTITVGSKLSKKINAKHVWHLREFGDLDYELKTPFGKWFQKYLYSGNNNFIAISQRILSHYKPFLSGQSIKLIYNGIKPIEPFERDWAKSKLEVCIIGLLHVNKGQLELLKAVEELVNHRSIKGLKVNVIGSGDEDYTRILENFVKENNLEAYVEFKGYCNNVSEILMTQDIGVMASSHEAFGRTTVEYMMAGLGVIASDGGANREIIKDGITGLLYPTGDHHALADRLSMFIKDRASLKKISENGKSTALDRFSSNRNSNNIHNLYLNILNKHS